jgi:hypothetical protein
MLAPAADGAVAIDAQIARSTPFSGEAHRHAPTFEDTRRMLHLLKPAMGQT